jgi:hypothetical protein
MGGAFGRSDGLSLRVIVLLMAYGSGDGNVEGCTEAEECASQKWPEGVGVRQGRD